MSYRKSGLLMAGVLVLSGIAFLIGWEEIIGIMSRMTMNQLMLMVLLQILTLLMTAHIWSFLLRQKGVVLSSGHIFLVNLTGTFVESVTPSVKLGGEAAKMVLLKQKSGLSYAELTAVAVVSKFYSLLPFALISLIVLGAAFMFMEVPRFVYMAFLGLMGFIGLLVLFLHGHRHQGMEAFLIQLPDPFGTGFRRLLAWMGDASHHARSLVLTFSKQIWLFFVASTVWLLYPVKVLLVAWILGYQLSPFLAVLAIYTAYLVSMVPLLPGGLATFEGTLTLVLTTGGMTPVEAFSIAMMTRMITFWIPLGGSAVATLFMVGHLHRKKEVYSD